MQWVYPEWGEMDGRVVDREVWYYRGFIQNGVMVELLTEKYRGARMGKDADL